MARMTMADKIIQRAKEHVQPGEIIQGAFAAQMTLGNRIGNGGYRTVVETKYRIFVATNWRFMVFKSGSFSQTVIKEFIEESPRDQALGEPKGLFYNVTIGGETMNVNFRYFDQIREIDCALEPKY